MKDFLFLAVLCPAAFGFELSRDTLESKFTGGDSVWLINRSPQTVRINDLYVKLLSGQIGSNLIFDVSNETRERIMGNSHFYSLQAAGDSLYVPPTAQGVNPEIRIPPRDSIHIRTVLYGNCIYCVSTSPLFNYAIEINFVERGTQPVKLVVVGNFVTGAVRRAAAPPGSFRQGVGPFRIDGRRQTPGSRKSATVRQASRQSISPSSR